MPFTDKLKEMVLQGCSTAELKDQMLDEGINSLRLAGLAKIKQGMTTIDEVLRCSASDRG
jgi:type IV pilus assembly protein PilB